MPGPVYRAERTGLLLVDPYNDFLSKDGKIFPMIQEIAEEVGLVDNLRKTVEAARKANIQIFFGSLIFIILKQK